MKTMKRNISAILLISLLSTAFSFPCIAEEKIGSESEPQILLSDGFEYSLGRTSSNITGYGTPANWRFEDSRNPKAFAINAGLTDSEKATGNYSLAIDAADRNNVGFVSDRINVSNKTPAFDISVKVKTDSNYSKNNPIYILYFYRNDYLLSTVTGKTFTATSEDWTENVIHIDYTSYPQPIVNFNNVRIKLATSFSGKSGDKAEGTVYFDDFSVTDSFDGSYTVLDVRNEEFVGWHHKGDTVTFKPVAEISEAIYEIKATLHNSYGEVVNESTLSPEEFETNGWVYTPKEVGHYTVGFKGKTDRGEIALVSAYRTPGNKPGTFIIPERSFVVANETKPMEERNQKLTWASHYSGTTFQTDYKKEHWEDIYKMHDLVGFSGIRLHTFGWTSETHNPVPPHNPGKGLYDWSYVDRVFNELGKYDFNVWTTLLYTPEWASTYAGKRKAPNGDAGSVVDYMVALPTKIEYFTEYITQFANRYGDDVDVWEIWNETTPKTAFFYNGTPEDYAYLLKNAYNHIKKIQPDDQVLMAGMVKGDSGHYADLLDAGIYDYTDAMVIHNRWPDYEVYQSKETERGYEVKPWINGEAHYILHYMNDGKLDMTEREEAFDLLGGYFWDLRGGVEEIALFQVDTAYDLECLPYKLSVGERALSCGLWRRRPFPEPRLAALVCHTFFEQMGQDFRYVSQHHLSNKARAIRFLSDGEPMLAIWNEDGNSLIPDEIKNCFTTKTTIVDWEGKSVAFDEQMRKGTVYFINGLDSEKLDLVPSSEKTVLTNTLAVKHEQVSTEVGYATKTQLFDEKNFTTISNDINWIDTDWTWVAKVADAEQNDFKSKFAVSLNEKGLYLMIEVDDSTPYFDNADLSKLYNTDSVQIGIDVTGEGYSNMRTEIDVAFTTGGVTMYKRAAADVMGAIPANWSMPGRVMDSKNARVTAESGKIHYKVFIPTSEMFPFEYNPYDKDFRMSLVINDNNGTARRGLLRWSNGIDGGKDVGKYGKIVLP